MRILRVYPFLPPRRGGMEKHVMRLSKEQLLQGHDVTIAYNFGEAMTQSDIRVLPSLTLENVRPQLLRDLLFYTSLCIMLWKNRLHYNVVHLHGDWSAFIFGPLISRICSASVLSCSIHGKIDGVGVKKFLYRFILSNFDFVYCTGLSEYNLLKNRIFPKTSLYWQPSGISDDFISNILTLSSKCFDVITVGSLLPVKNHKLFIDVAKHLPFLNFAIAGDGPLRDDLSRYIKNLGISNVTLLGAIDTAQVVELNRKSKIFLLTSYSEGTSTAMLEAMASGNVVVTTKSNDYSQILGQNECGIIVDSFEPLIIAHQIQAILSDDSKFLDIANRARNIGNHFRWINVANQVSSWMIYHGK